VLFELWNSFENRLPASFIRAKILEVGDLLFSLQVFSHVTSTNTFDFLPTLTALQVVLDVGYFSAGLDIVWSVCMCLSVCVSV